MTNDNEAIAFGGNPALTGEMINRMIARTREQYRTRRVDCWLEIGDGHYRLKLGRRAMELEERLGKGIFAIYGSVARGRYEQHGESFGFATEAAASRPTCREVVRLALIEGGQAVINGRMVRVDGPAANQLLTNYVDDEPAGLIWDLAFAVLSCACEGREMTDVEKASERPYLDVIPPVEVDEPA